MMYHVWRLIMHIKMFDYSDSYRNHFMYAPSQWETMLQCNVISHWLGTYTKRSLWLSGYSSSKIKKITGNGSVIRRQHGLWGKREDWPFSPSKCPSSKRSCHTSFPLPSGLNSRRYVTWADWKQEQIPYLSSYLGYFREPHWKSMGLPEISRVTWQHEIWSFMGIAR